MRKAHDKSPRPDARCHRAPDREDCRGFRTAAEPSAVRLLLSVAEWYQASLSPVLSKLHCRKRELNARCHVRVIQGLFLSPVGAEARVTSTICRISAEESRQVPVSANQGNLQQSPASR